MTKSARRPIPHIEYSAELEAAALAVSNARAANGHAVSLCANPLDVGGVRAAIASVARFFDDPAFYGESEDQKAVELNAAENLTLLCALLTVHLKAGNT